jgi:ligand-binding sensor domain-containing protein
MTHRNNRILLTLVLPLLLGGFVLPTQPVTDSNDEWTTYSNANSVNDLAFDHDGYLWAATDFGVFRWDINQKTYIHFSIDNGLPSNAISAIEPAKNGSIWIGTKFGQIAQMVNNHWLEYKFSELSDKMSINDIFEDSRGTIWISTNGAGMVRINKDNRKVFLLEDGIGSLSVSSIIEDSDGNLWFKSELSCCSSFDDKNVHINSDETKIIAGITKFDGKNWTILFSDFIEKDFGVVELSPFYDFGIKGNDIWINNGYRTVYKFTKDGIIDEIINSNAIPNSEKILFDQAGNMWLVCYGYGVVKFDGTKWQWFTKNDGLLSDNVISMTIDNRNILWIGTDDGIAFFDGKKWDSFRVSDLNGHIPANHIYNLAFDQIGKVWLATSDGVLRQTENGWKTYSISDGLPSNTIKDINIAQDWTVWVTVFTKTGYSLCSFDGKYWREYEKDIPFDSFEAELNDRFTLPQLNDYQPVQVATSSTGDQAFAKYHKDTEENEALGDNISGIDFSISDTKSIISLPTLKNVRELNRNVILLSPNRTLWVGSSDGVYYFRNNQWNHYSSKDGLSGNLIYRIFQSPKGEIWFITDAGLSRLTES